MEIRNRIQGNGERPRNDPADDVIDFTRTDRERIAKSVQEFQSSRLEHLRKPPAAIASQASDEAREPVDEVEVSAASQALSEAEDPAEVARRRAQVDVLRRAVVEGSLATPERVERAARRLLGG